jgi:hypothetical protein
MKGNRYLIGLFSICGVTIADTPQRHPYLTKKKTVMRKRVSRPLGLVVIYNAAIGMRY